MIDLTINLIVGGAVRATHPIFNDDIQLQYKREDNQIFSRETIDGTIHFVREDFDFIERCGAETEFTLRVYREDTFLGESKFFKSDCEFDYDSRIVDVKLTTKDRYEKILGHLDDTFNLVNLAPTIEALSVPQRGVLQFYMVNDIKVTNVVGSIDYEVDATPPENPEDYAGKVYDNHLIDITEDDILDPSYIGIVGRYIGNLQDPNGVAFNEDKSLKIVHSFRQVGGSYYHYLELFDTYNEAIICTSQGTGLFPSHIQFLVPQVAFTPVTKSIIIQNRSIYGRILHNNASAQVKVRRADLDDITDANKNYEWVTPMGQLGALTNRFIVSMDTQDAPTKWGRNSLGKYFVEPSIPVGFGTTAHLVPIGHSLWSPASYWFVSDRPLASQIDADYSVAFTLKDTYPLWSVIKVLLGKVDDSLSFANDDAHSIFFNSELGIPEGFEDKGWVRSFNDGIYLAPITNLKKTRYEQAAQRGDISLGQVFEMLRKVFQCYWWIDDDKLRIEHISYFKNNHSYIEGEVAPTIDVTKIRNPRLDLAWTHETNKITFDKGRCPKRYEFGWSEESTAPFKGYPIDIRDKHLNEDASEDAIVNGFVSDLDLVIITPNLVSDDCFALIQASHEREVPIFYPNFTFSDIPSYVMNNGYLSLFYCALFYYPYDLGGWQAYMEGGRIDVKGTRGYAKQTLTFPTTIDKVRSLGRIKTALGIGDVDEIKLNGSTLIAEATLALPYARDWREMLYVWYYPSTIAHIRNEGSDVLRVVYAIAGDAIMDVVTIDIDQLDVDITLPQGATKIIILNAYKI